MKELMMKNIVAISLLSFAMSAYANSNWELVAVSSDNDKNYVDKNSYQKSGDSITFWKRTNYGKRDEFGDLSSKMQLTINCRTREIIIRYLMNYDDWDNSGKITYNKVAKDSWSPIPPDTVNWALLKYVCK